MVFGVFAEANLLSADKHQVKTNCLNALFDPRF